MKQSRFFTLLALFLAALLALSSCSFGGTTVKRVLDKNAVDAAPAPFTQGGVIADLTGSTFVKAYGDLVYLTVLADVGVNQYQKHIIYNVKTNKIVFTMAESALTGVRVTVGGVNEGDETDFSYFQIATTTRVVNDLNPSVTETKEETVLYDANGTKLAEAARAIDAVVAADLLYFNGKCYRADANGALAPAFDYSTLAQFPALTGKCGEYYYEEVLSKTNGVLNVVRFYDETLNYVSTYVLSTASNSYTSSLLCLSYLEGKMLVQYQVLAAEDASDYDYLINTYKYELRTVLFDVESGKERELNCEYFVRAQITLDEEGMDEKTVDRVYDVLLIEDQCLTTNQVALLNNDGTFTILDPIQGDPIQSVEFLTTDRWLVTCTPTYTTTSLRQYLINGKGEIVGEVTRAKAFGAYLYANGVIYDCNLAPLYDYEAAGFDVLNAFEDSLLLQKESGELQIYAGTNGPINIIGSNEKRSLAQCGEGFFTITNNNDPQKRVLEVYNVLGTQILTIELSSVATQNVSLQQLTYDTEGALFRGLDKSGMVVYYRFR